jgi:hypothetical protein
LVALTILVSPSPTITSVLLSAGVREIVVIWLVPAVVVFFHLGRNDALSDLERRQWRRQLLVGGWAVALIYLCSEDRRLPIQPSDSRR